MNIRNVPVDKLVLDPNLNLRDRLDDDTVERYMENWERMPPITAFEVDGRLLVADGFHRHAAAVRLKRRTIPAEVRGGSFPEALDFVTGANLRHGLPLSRAERRRAVEVKLRLHHDRSDRHLAEELGVSRELIAKVRRQLAEAGQIPCSETRIGSDGKIYPAGLPKDPNEHRPRGQPIAPQDDPRDWGGRESDPTPWDEPEPIGTGPRRRSGISPPWEEAEVADAKVIANAPPATPAVPTIDEMLTLMAQQVMEVVNWTLAEGFPE
ncbi:MAG: ParB N-terminal domain-containing protein, partial [Isosphaeraceae bacterium]|nr:ParB N-terminal domain-containing protein [Isosphaeraceae bacterium]